MEPSHVGTKSEVARLLGRSPASVARYSKEPWWPAKEEAGWPMAAIRAAVRANVARTGKGARAKPVAPPARGEEVEARPSAAPRTEAELADDASGYEQSLVATLRSPDSSALQIAQATARLVALRVTDGLLDPSQRASGDMRDLKQALEELRKAESDYMTLEVKRGTLIERDVAKAVVAQVCQRLVSALSNVRNGLAMQVEAWLGDEAFVKSGPDERRVAVRSWVERESRSLLATTAEEVEEMIVEEVASG